MPFTTCASFSSPTLMAITFVLRAQLKPERS
jgi:hypothetical protein